MNVTVGIIGLNDYKNLKKLLTSLENMIMPENATIEIIYVDDGSLDASCLVFNKHLSQYKKTLIENKKNYGRGYSRNKIISQAKYNWILFLNSNILITDNHFLINLNREPLNCDAYMCNLTFTCEEDKSFENYLNHPNRGLHQHNHLEEIKYTFLLFSCCLINKQIILNHNIYFNEKLHNYGGEELEWASKLNAHDAKIVYHQYALCARTNHPSLYQHLPRLTEFGRTNLKQLSPENKKLIIKLNMLFQPYIINKLIIYAVYFLMKCCPIKSYGVIRIMWYCSIMKGYYNKTK